MRESTFPGEYPIGRALDREAIVGVVGDVRQRLRLAAEPEIYRPLSRTSYSAATLVVSGDIDATVLTAPVRAAIRDVNPGQPVFDVRTMDQVIMASHGDVNLSLALIGLFAGLALILGVGQRLRCHLLHRRPAAAGVRHPAGARRQSATAEATGARARRWTSPGGCCIRRRRCSRHDAVPSSAPLSG